MCRPLLAQESAEHGQPLTIKKLTRPTSPMDDKRAGGGGSVEAAGAKTAARGQALGFGVNNLQTSRTLFSRGGERNQALAFGVSRSKEIRV